MPKYAMLKNDVGVIVKTDSRNKEGKYQVMGKYSKSVEYHNGIHEITEQEYNDYKQPAKRGSKKS